jgi:hypothetical protein
MDENMPLGQAETHVYTLLLVLAALLEVASEGAFAWARSCPILLPTSLRHMVPALEVNIVSAKRMQSRCRMFLHQTCEQAQCPRSRGRDDAF